MTSGPFHSEEAPPRSWSVTHLVAGNTHNFSQSENSQPRAPALMVMMVSLILLLFSAITDLSLS